MGVKYHCNIIDLVIIHAHKHLSQCGEVGLMFGSLVSSRLQSIVSGAWYRALNNKGSTTPNLSGTII